MADVYLSIGSNIERHKNIRSCMDILTLNFEEVRFSRIYETPAEGFIGNPFYNLAAYIKTSLSPEKLDKQLKDIENQHQRDRTAKKFSSRTLDIDILLYDDKDLHPDMDIPRDEITRYPFVLFPLIEIAPELKHPTLEVSLSDLPKKYSIEASELIEVHLTNE